MTHKEVAGEEEEEKMKRWIRWTSCRSKISDRRRMRRRRVRGKMTKKKKSKDEEEGKKEW